MVFLKPTKQCYFAFLGLIKMKHFHSMLKSLLCMGVRGWVGNSCTTLEKKACIIGRGGNSDSPISVGWLQTLHAANVSCQNPVWISDQTFFRIRRRQFATFPTDFPADFLRKPQGKTANGDLIIAGCLPNEMVCHVQSQSCDCGDSATASATLGMCLILLYFWMVTKQIVVKQELSVICKFFSTDHFQNNFIR